MVGPVVSPRPPGLRPWLIVVRRLLVEQDALGSAVQVVVLAALQRPEEGGKADGAEQQRDRDEIDENIHAGALLSGPVRGNGKARPGRTATASRNELAVTRMEDDDIATAAMSGVTIPAMASGTATQL
jgi:hypothetical protein